MPDAPMGSHGPIKLLWMLALTLLFSSVDVAAIESTCFGTVSNGQLKNGVQLPASGKNFGAYSSLGSALGRTYVHSSVRDIVISAYSRLAETMPNTMFVYGETGWSSGGRIRPHRTHQSGTSVDFFVPVLDQAGRSVRLPTSALNKFGYDLEFDSDARHEDFSIDFEAMGEHLFQLQSAAEANGTNISLVIFDPRFMPRLFRTRRGAYLQKSLAFMQKDAWVRHDEHYHVNFGIACKASE